MKALTFHTYFWFWTCQPKGLKINVRNVRNISMNAFKDCKRRYFAMSGCEHHYGLFLLCVPHEALTTQFIKCGIKG